MIATERQKQIDKHGFTAEHHVNHPEYYEDKQLNVAAATLLLQDLTPEETCSDVPKNWDYSWFTNIMERPLKERLIIAGALIAAELDRLDKIEETVFMSCTSCEKQFNMEIMHQDSGDNDFCEACWNELSAGMQADYEDLKAKGEID